MTILADSALKVAVVLLLALGASGILRRRSAAARHWVLAVGMACAIAAPGLGLLVPSWSIALPRSSSVAAPLPSSSVTTGTANPREAVEAEPRGVVSPPAAAPLL